MDTFMPCQPYLIRHIKDNNELISYARFFFDTCAKNNIDRDEAILRYKATASTILPKDRPEMFKYRDATLSDEEFVLTVKSDPELPKSMLCSKYCKNVLGSNELCKTCPFFSGYSCENVDVELSILKYAVTTFDNLLHLKNILTEPKNVFKSRTDLLLGLGEKEPLPVPLTLHVYNVIDSLGSSFFDTAGDELEKLIPIRARVLASIMSSARNGRYNRISAIPAVKQEKIWQIFCESVVNAETVSDISASLASIIPNGSKRKVDKEELLPDIEESMVSTGLFGKVKEVVAAPGEDSLQAGSEDATSLPEDAADDMMGEKNLSSDTNDDFSDEDLPFGKPDIVNEGSSIEEDLEETADEDDGVDGEANSDSQSVEEADTSEQAPSVKPVEKEPVPQILAKDENAVKKAVPLMLSVDDPLYLPHISTLTYADPENMDKDIALSRIIPVEIFRDDNEKHYYVFYIKRKYYICKPDSERVKSLMSNKHLLKICWQPFDIYSLCAKNDINVKELYSILEHELSAFPGELSASYRNVCSKYCDHLSDYSDPELIGNTMPYYVRIYSLQDDAVKRTGVNLQKLHGYFEILGRSYHRDRNLKDYSKLFKMQTSGQIEFHNNYTMSSKVDGYELSFTVDNLDDESPVTLFMDTLLRFEPYKFLELQLVYISERQLLLFVPANMYEFVSTYIQLALDRYALAKGNTKLSVYVASKFLTPNRTVKDRNRAAVAPKSLNDVLDCLASLYTIPTADAQIKRITIASLEKTG